MTVKKHIFGDDDPLLTAREASEFLGVTEETLSIWRCTNRYDLPFVKMGRLVRYRKSHLIKFIEDRTQTSTTKNKKKAKRK